MTCVGRLPSPTPSPPSPISPMRLSSALSSFYSSHFSIPATTGTDTLLPSPNQPAWYSSPLAVSFIHPHLLLHSAQTSFNPLPTCSSSSFFPCTRRSSETWPAPYRQRVAGGGRRIATPLLSVLASPDFRRSSPIAFLYSTDRDYSGRVNGSDRKG